MKNTSITTKMVLSFGAVALLTLCIGIISIFGIVRINGTSGMLYGQNLMAASIIGDIRENLQDQRALLQSLAFGGDADTAIRKNRVEMDGYISDFKKSHLTDRLSKEFSDFEKIYNNYFLKNADVLLNDPKNADAKDLEFLLSSKMEMKKMMESIDYCASANLVEAEINLSNSKKIFVQMRQVLILSTALIALFAILMSFLLPARIARPIKKMLPVADAVAVGDMSVSYDYDCKNEVGRLAHALVRMKTEISDQIDILDSIANADLTVKPSLRSEKDTLGKALIKLADSLNSIIAKVSDVSAKVMNESQHVARESQELAQGTTEQAASVEELSSAVFQVSLNTKENAKLAERAAALSDSVRSNAIEGGEQMKRLSQAVSDISVASRNIEKIIKVIDEIAFQTNILALNAAVEASNAGQSGDGFAVVASEVRGLAFRSAESAKETGELIADTMDKVQLGASIAEQTSESFKKIVDGIVESTRLISDIAKSSEEQASAIEQVNTGITQVAHVINANSGAAEKCAAAAEKMSDQAKVLRKTMETFKTRGGSSAGGTGSGAAGKPETASFADQGGQKPPIKIDLSPAIPSDDFGKY